MQTVAVLVFWIVMSFATAPMVEANEQAHQAEVDSMYRLLGRQIDSLETFSIKLDSMHSERMREWKEDYGTVNNYYGKQLQERHERQKQEIEDMILDKAFARELLKE